MRNFGNTEKQILFAAIIVFVVMTYFLIDDSLLFPADSTQKLETIGKISFAQNDVRRKNVETFNWLPANQLDTVFQNDSIFTGDRSAATIRLQDGSLIKIAPNSLINLNINSGQMQLNLQYGNLVGEISQGSSITVKTDQEVVNLENKKGSLEKSKIQLNKKRAGSVDMKLIAGEVKLSNKKKQVVQEITKNTHIKLASTGEIKKVEKVPLKIVTTNELKWAKSRPDDLLSLQWKSEDFDQKYAVEISTDPEFKENRTTHIVNDQQFKVNQNLTPGSYYWRVKSIDNGNRVSEVSPVQKFEVEPPTYKTFVPKPKPVVATSEASSNFAFSPNLDRLPSAENLDPYDAPRSQDNLQDETMPAPTNLPLPGVTSQPTPSPTPSPIPTPLPSPTPLVANRTFQAPVITYPETGDVISKEVETKNQEEPTLGVTLKWNPKPDLKTYKIELSGDKEFRSLLQSRVVTGQSFETQKLKSGRYYFRMKGGPNTEEMSDWSESVSFDLKLKKHVAIAPTAPRLLTPVVDFKVPSLSKRDISSSITPIAKWETVTKAKNYIFEMANNPNFTSSIKSDTLDTLYSWSNYKPGKYFFRVFSVGTSGLMSPPSQVGMFNIVLDQIQISPTEPIIPINGNIEPREVVLNWTPTPFTAGYLVQMADNQSFENAKAMESTKNSLQIKVTPGNYFIRVRAFDANKSPITDFSAPSEVTYLLPSNLRPPRLADPIDNTSIFLQSEGAPFVWLRWRNVQKATSYKVEVSETSDFSKILVSKIVQKNGYLLNEVVPFGKLYWRVRAEANKGLEYSEWSTPGYFIIFIEKNEKFEE